MYLTFSHFRQNNLITLQSDGQLSTVDSIYLVVFYKVASNIELMRKAMVS